MLVSAVQKHESAYVCMLSHFSHVRLLWSYGLQHPGSSIHGDTPGKNTGVGCHFLLLGIFLIQRWNPCFMSAAWAGGFFITSTTWEAYIQYTYMCDLAIYRETSVKVLVAQLCLILYNPMDYHLPGSSVHGILHAKILKWVTIPSRGCSWPRDRTWVFHISGRFFSIWAIKEVHRERALIQIIIKYWKVNVKVWYLFFTCSCSIKH